MELGTVLGVWAHPDDDIYLSAGLMARAASGGDRVVDVTATRGEGGSTGRSALSLREDGRGPHPGASAIPGGVGGRGASLPRGPIDIDMETGLDPAGAPQVRDIMNEVQPDSVLTFGPDGMTGHVAHQDVSRWATEAFHTVAKEGARLYYACYSPEWADEWLDKLTALGMFRVPAPVMPRSELAIDFPLPADLLEVKMRSIKEHASQIEELIEVFGDEGLRRVLGRGEFLVGGREGGAMSESSTQSERVMGAIGRFAEWALTEGVVEPGGADFLFGNPHEIAPARIRGGAPEGGRADRSRSLRLQDERADRDRGDRGGVARALRRAVRGRRHLDDERQLRRPVDHAAHGRRPRRRDRLRVAAVVLLRSR